MIKKILTILGGLAFAGVIVAGGFYAFNADFRADVNYNVFGIERTVEDETPTDEETPAEDDVNDGLADPDGGNTDTTVEG